MSGLSKNAYKLFLIERLLDTHSLPMFRLMEEIRKIISGEVTAERTTPMQSFTIKVTIDAEMPDGDTLKDAILQGTFDLNQAIVDQGPGVALQIGMSTNPNLTTP